MTDKIKNSLSRRFEFDGEGRIVINMTVSDDSDFLSVFSAKSTPVISSGVADFLESSVSSLPPGAPLTLRIHGSCIDEREKELYRTAIGEYYAEKYSANEREFKRNNISVLLLAISGVLVLALNVFLGKAQSLIGSEVIDIIAWVLLWEAVDLGVFAGRSLRLARKRFSALRSMKVEYPAGDVCNQ